MAYYGALHQGATMGRAMTILAIIGILAAMYFAYRYGVY